MSTLCRRKIFNDVFNFFFLLILIAQLDNVTGKVINKNNLNMGIYTSSLLEQEKFNAISDLEKCLDGKLIS